VTDFTDRTFDARPSTDPLNDQHLSRTVLPTQVPRRIRSWRGPYWRIDQGPVGACVGFGWTVEAMSMPVIVRPQPNTKAAAEAFALDRYHQSQLVDEYSDTPPAEGSSLNAGAKVMRSLGYITGWRWHRTVDDLIGGLITDGPQVTATPWHEAMFRPDDNGIVGCRRCCSRLALLHRHRVLHAVARSRSHPLPPDVGTYLRVERRLLHPGH
jgi:hypothetical protein